MAFSYDQYQYDIHSDLYNPYLRGWPQARYGQAFMRNEQSHRSRFPYSALSGIKDDGASFAIPMNPHRCSSLHSQTDQQQPAMVPGLGPIPSPQIPSFIPPLPAYTPAQQSVTQKPPNTSKSSCFTPSRVSSMNPSPDLQPLKAPFDPKALIEPDKPNSIGQIRGVKIYTPEGLTKSSHTVPKPIAETGPAINMSPTTTTLPKPTEDKEMRDRDSPTSSSASVSFSSSVSSIHHHVLHLEEEAEEWKDRIEVLNSCVASGARKITAMKETFATMKAQKTRVQSLLQQLDASIQKTVVQGREMANQGKVAETERTKLEQRLKERLELIECLQGYRPSSSTPIPASALIRPITPPIAKKPTETPCPITHCDCLDCGCRMRKSKKDIHTNSHCWGRCRNCAKEGLACNAGMSTKWTACFQCAQHGMNCAKPAKTRYEAQETLKKSRGTIDSLGA